MKLLVLWSSLGVLNIQGDIDFGGKSDNEPILRYLLITTSCSNFFSGQVYSLVRNCSTYEANFVYKDFPISDKNMWFSISYQDLHKHIDITTFKKRKIKATNPWACQFFQVVDLLQILHVRSDKWWSDHGGKIRRTRQSPKRYSNQTNN